MTGGPEGGAHGNLARAAAKAHEAIRVAAANDTFAIDEEEVDESSLPERRRRRSGGRA